MSSVYDKLVEKGLIIDYPSHLKNNVHYECMTGSIAYGVSDDTSDIDVYGFSIPPKHIIFPYSYGHIVGFGKKPYTFNQFQKHHIIDTNGKEYDISIYNIVRFFQLCSENNPNMVDALFVPHRCVLHSTSVGNHVRDYKHIFLSKLAYHKFRGYAFSQMKKMKDKKINEYVDYCKKFDIPFDCEEELFLKPLEVISDSEKRNREIRYMMSIRNDVFRNGKLSKRVFLVETYGYDVKFAYHVIRLIEECRMILEEHTLDLTRNRKMLRSIRNGEWTIDMIESYFENMMPVLEDCYNKSNLRYSVDEDHIRSLLLECIEMHYGSVSEYQDNARIMIELENIEKSTRILRSVLS